MRWIWFFNSKNDYFDHSDVRQDLNGSKWLIRFVALCIICFLAWANWAELEQITRAPGTVVANSKTQILQSEDGGSIKSIFVQEGDRVRRGDTLLELDQTEADADLEDTLSKKASLQANLRRLEAEVFDLKKIDMGGLDKKYSVFYDNQKILYQKRKQKLNDEIAAIDQIANLVDKELRLNRPLLSGGHVSETDILKLERQLAELNAKKTNLRNQFFEKAQEEMSKLQSELASVEQVQIKKKRKLSLNNLKSPADGIIKNIKFNNIGGVIRAGEEVLHIVPVDDSLIIEAKVSPKDIAFLEVGQEVTVKIDAYDYTVFGDLQGQLIYISADTLQNQKQQNEETFYKIKIKTIGNRLSKIEKKKLTIIPGMTTTVEIITGKNTVLSYLTKPVTKTLSESLGER